MSKGRGCSPPRLGRKLRILVALTQQVIFRVEREETKNVVFLCILIMMVQFDLARDLLNSFIEGALDGVIFIALTRNPSLYLLSVSSF